MVYTFDIEGLFAFSFVTLTDQKSWTCSCTDGLTTSWGLPSRPDVTFVVDWALKNQLSISSDPTHFRDSPVEKYFDRRKQILRAKFCLTFPRSSQVGSTEMSSLML